uniref:Myb/SANT-like DNA-binding domain-containing protein n=1 Tax=Cyprinus carpio TaxID=7962 RepID=A0A8C2B7V8_CYPCA
MEEDSAGQWSMAEVTCLLTLWGEESVQDKIKVSYRNKSVFKDISAAMSEQGYRHSWLQRKVKSLKSKYKEVKDHNNKSGHGILGDYFQHNIKKMFFEQQIRILECFLKDHVTGVMMLKIQL